MFLVCIALYYGDADLSYKHVISPEHSKCTLATHSLLGNNIFWFTNLRVSTASDKNTGKNPCVWG